MNHASPRNGMAPFLSKLLFSITREVINHELVIVKVNNIERRLMMVPTPTEG